ncbi:MAG: hypothetical protein ACLP0A_02465 [Verrucomicrobiia bacterium]
MKFSEIINDQQLATEAIRRWITVAICMVLAVVVAYWIAYQQFLILAVVAGVAATVFVIVGMQRSAWLLIVITWYLTGQIHALPVPLSISQAMVLLVTFSYLMQRVLGQTSRQSRGALGALVVINCFWIALTFAFHPVGVHALGAATMGGRPYFDMFIGWCAYWVIVHLPESYKSVVRIPLWLMASMTFSTLIGSLVYIFPSSTPYVWFFYSSVSTSEYVGSLRATTAAEGVRRLDFLGPFGVTLLQLLSAYYLPRKFLNPMRWQFYLSALGFVAILVSGYRNRVAIAFAYMALAAWFHRGWREVVLGGTIGAAFLGLLVFSQGRLFDLPLAAQRALADLPGQWNEAVRDEVKGSNARWDWWRQLLQEGGVAKNWWIGDGFGVSEADFGATAHLGFEESADISGAFHNGPLTTIRYAGVVGLILFYALMIGAATSSVKCVRRCRGTPLLPVAIFLAVQLVWAPVHYTFIFGAYDSQVPEHLFLIGLLTLVWRMSERRPPSTEPAVVARPLSWNNGGTRVSA